MRYNIFRARDRFQENHSTLKLIQTSVFERKKKDFHRISIPPFFFPIFILLNANTFRNTYMCVFCFKFRFPVMLECNIRTQTERGFLVWFEYESFRFFLLLANHRWKTQMSRTWIVSFLYFHMSNIECKTNIETWVCIVNMYMENITSASNISNYRTENNIFNSYA